MMQSAYHNILKEDVSKVVHTVSTEQESQIGKMIQPAKQIQEKQNMWDGFRLRLPSRACL